MRDDIFLTIAIPTFNRANKLRSLLNDIHSELLHSTIAENIEILISDNASTDSTQDIVKYFDSLNRPYKLTYRKNDENYGVSRNFMISAIGSSGLFVWLLGDDDRLINGAIQYVYNELNCNSNVGFAFVNYYIDDTRSLAAITIDPEVYLAQNFFLLTSKVLTNYSQVSTVILNRTLINEENMSKYIKTLYPHLFWVANIARYKPSLVIGKPLFINVHPGMEETRNNSSKRENYPFDFYLYAHLDYIKFIKYIYNFNLLSLRQRYKLYCEARNQNLNQIIFYKITTKNYDLFAIKSAILIMFSFFYLSPIFWLLHVPILVLPSSVSRFLEPYRWKYMQVKSLLWRGISGCIYRK
jgi:glycosyltransferase involved in cell wall biosynthesis